MGSLIVLVVIVVGYFVIKNKLKTIGSVNNLV
jgi:hypothetical protein